MSSKYPVDYFPPQGTKHKWLGPSLRNRPYVCQIDGVCFPQNATLYCDRNLRGFLAWVQFSSLTGGCVVLSVESLFPTALAACRAAETVADFYLKQDTQPWMKKAVAARWRPPCSKDAVGVGRFPEFRVTKTGKVLGGKRAEFRLQKYLRGET